LTESNLIVASLWRQRIKQALKEGYARGLFMDGAGVSAALHLGASAGQLGTAFNCVPGSQADAAC
jgi:NAD(P)H-dependent flavin oxidoreductase YrpB (nitropropane dioxygenase family)